MAKAADRDWTWLAWAGWSARIAPRWRPVSIDGAVSRGRVMIGDGETAIAQVNWWRPSSRRFDAERWVQVRIKSNRAQPKNGAPAPKGFVAITWAAAKPRGRRGKRTLWYGYQAQANLAVEVVINAAAQDSATAVASLMLPSLAACGMDEPINWSVYGASFRSPPGWDVAGRQLLAGNIALLLVYKRLRMVLRQVYPGRLALARRPLEAWMRTHPFRERRRFHPDGDPLPWTGTLWGRETAGLAEIGRKRLRWPAHGIRPIQCVRVGVVDAELDRLLLVEAESRHSDAEMLAADAMAGMNWAHWERLACGER